MQYYQSALIYSKSVKYVYSIAFSLLQFATTKKTLVEKQQRTII